ncbi:phosphodiesterase [Vibrio sp. Sgm 22]|uniref:phosphodiesterase n=1 Tax=unclassified Vibrio TaxID=2614977 RepID=UPI002248A3DB|nr:MULTISPECIES: phosphodiesterase [unclassified Vibrio]MCX2757386.1 phosphodiesterase [Vibrio sp. 14G-20]MCX2774072.1 phosphodiesterase [Vibrio sp. Sgm 22]
MLIAQLTDLHIKQGGKQAYKKVDTLKCLYDAVNHINDLRPRPDCVVVTGDLGDFGLIEEYQLINEALEKFDMPLYVIPGNHDDRHNLREGLSNLVSFDHDEYCNFVVDSHDEVLIGLDSSVLGKPYGYLTADTLGWLSLVLEQYRDRAIMLFIHHPPMAVGLNHMDVQNLQNADEFYEVIKPFSNILGICAGHLHRPITAVWNSIPVWVGPSHSHSVTLDLDPKANSSFSLEPKAIQLLTIAKKSVVSHISYIEDSDGPYPFFDEYGALID